MTNTIICVILYIELRITQIKSKGCVFMIVKSELKYLGEWVIITPSGEVYGCHRFDTPDDYEWTLKCAVEQFGEGTKVYSQKDYESIKVD